MKLQTILNEEYSVLKVQSYSSLSGDEDFESNRFLSDVEFILKMTGAEAGSLSFRHTFSKKYDELSEDDKIRVDKLVDLGILLRNKDDEIMLTEFGKEWLDSRLNDKLKVGGLSFSTKAASYAGLMLR